MPNYLRARDPGGTFFFTLVTERRRPILTGDLARSLLAEAVRITPGATGSYSYLCRSTPLGTGRSTDLWHPAEPHRVRTDFCADRPATRFAQNPCGPYEVRRRRRSRPAADIKPASETGSGTRMAMCIRLPAERPKNGVAALTLFWPKSFRPQATSEPSERRAMLW